MHSFPLNCCKKANIQLFCCQYLLPVGQAKQSEKDILKELLIFNNIFYFVTFVASFLHFHRILIFHEKRPQYILFRQHIYNVNAEPLYYFIMILENSFVLPNTRDQKSYFEIQISEILTWI